MERQPLGLAHVKWAKAEAVSEPQAALEPPEEVAQQGRSLEQASWQFAEMTRRLLGRKHRSHRPAQR